MPIILWQVAIYAAHVNQTRNSLKMARIHGRNTYELLIINVKTQQTKLKDNRNSVKTLCVCELNEDLLSFNWVYKNNRMCSNKLMVQLVGGEICMY